MGGIGRALFGGSKNKSESGNRAYEQISGALTPVLNTGTNMFNRLSDILSGGFDDYKKNAGFDFLLNKGTRDISGSAASRGLLNSGSTAKALANYESNLGNTMYINYLDRLSDAAKTGLNASSAIIGAGQYGKGTGTSQTGALTALFG